MEQKTLLIYPDDNTGGWMIDHHGPDRATVIDLFGTPVLPTPFCKPITPEAVFASIVNLNPGAAVYIFHFESEYRETLADGFRIQDMAPCIRCSELSPLHAMCPNCMIEDSK